jgi:hypothetical protein
MVAPDGTELNSIVGHTYEAQGQASGFLGMENTGAQAGYRVDVIDTTGSVVDQRVLATSGGAQSHRDPRGGMVLVETPSDSTTPPSLEALDASAATRFRATLPVAFVSGFGVDLEGNTLVLNAVRSPYGEGSVAGVWVDHSGRVGDMFEAASGLAGLDASQLELYPRSGGGLFLLQRRGSHSTWLLAYDALATKPTDAPGWLKAHSDTTLAIVRGAKGYALLPLPSDGETQCGQTVDVVAVDGTTCGRATFGWTGNCSTQEISVGVDGTVIQRLPEKQEECASEAHCKCGWRWWRGFLD